MTIDKEIIEALLKEIDKLHYRHELADKVTEDYFEPGMMEYLNQSDGCYDESSGYIELRFESKGTRYGDRTEQIETLSVGDTIQIERDPENAFNSNNFILKNAAGKDVGNMPAELCNAIAPLYDSGRLSFIDSKVSFVEPISKRSRHAKQAILFVEMEGQIIAQEVMHGIQG